MAVGVGWSAAEYAALDQDFHTRGARLDEALDLFELAWTEDSYRTGWDPQGMDPAVIIEERAAYTEAGVDHVVVAPWRTTADDWIRSMELLVELVQPDPPDPGAVS